MYFFQLQYFCTYVWLSVIWTIIWTVRKSFVIFATQLAGGLLLKKLKYFEIMLNICEFSQVREKVESSLVYANKLFWITQPYFSTDKIKQS